MAASKIETLQDTARGYALDLLEALMEVTRADTVSIVACARPGVPSIHCTIHSGGLAIWKFSLVGDELPDLEA